MEVQRIYNLEFKTTSIDSTPNYTSSNKSHLHPDYFLCGEASSFEEGTLKKLIAVKERKTWCKNVEKVENLRQFKKMNRINSAFNLYLFPTKIRQDERNRL